MKSTTTTPPIFLKRSCRAIYRGGLAISPEYGFPGPAERVEGPELTSITVKASRRFDDNVAARG
jgi:hypothetical protein